MKQGLAALLAGALFGVGLVIAGMTIPAKVTGFLDVTGNWDPSLAVVMAAALAVAVPAFRRITARGRPVLDTRFHLPVKASIDPSLVAGSLIVGVGWGLAGFCPGPALAGLVTGRPDPWIFVGFLLAGSWVATRVR